MAFIKGLKPICDLCFYFAFATLIGSLAGSQGIIITLPIFMVVSFLFTTLHRYKKLKWVSFLPFFLLFIITPLTVIHLVILSPGVIYLFRYLLLKENSTEEVDYKGPFFIFLSAFGVIFIINLISTSWIGDVNQLPNESITFALLFLLFSVFLMRMARHDDRIVKQAKFKLMNGLSMVGIFLITIIAGNTHLQQFLLNIALTLFLLLWRFILYPILAAIVWLIEQFYRLLGLIFGDGGEVELEIMQNLSVQWEEMYDYVEGTFTAEASPLLRAVAIVVGILVFLGAVAFIFKYLNSKTTTSEKRDDGVIETWENLDEQLTRRRLFKGQNKQPVGAIYSDFLRLLKKHTYVILPTSTSEDVQSMLKESTVEEPSQQLRQKYLPLRYGGIVEKKEDAKEMKKLYREIKAEIDKKTENG